MRKYKLHFLNHRLYFVNVTSLALNLNLGASPPQAVFKWENGSVPDTELLPRIADYFQVPVEMEEETRDVYPFHPTPSFPAMLLFARELIDTPEHFTYFHGGRRKPYPA